MHRNLGFDNFAGTAAISHCRGRGQVVQGRFSWHTFESHPDIKDIAVMCENSSK